MASGLTNKPESIYLKDGKLKDKMKTWVSIYHLLIEKCNENEGYVKDCDIVLASFKGLQRKKEDFYSQFFKENVAKASSKDKIKKQEIEQI